MNRHPLTPPETYTYERHSDGIGHSVLALGEDGNLAGIENIRKFNIPFVPERWKQVVHEVRMRRAEVNAAANADENLERLSQDWYFILQG